MGVSDDIGKRYLGIAGPFIHRDAHADLDSAIARIKKNHIPSSGATPVLHRKEIMQCRGPFTCLQDEKRKLAFNKELISLVANLPYKLLAVTIDKSQHGTKTYRSLRHPYHYCLHALLERYCGFLDRVSLRGHVMAESRGKVEDYLLREAYREVYKCGTSYISHKTVQKTLASADIEIRKKGENVSGLQLADLLAHPTNRDILVAYGRLDCVGSEFTRSIAAAFKSKYNKKFGDGRINGYGRILLS